MLFAITARCRLPASMLETDFPDLSFRVLLRESARRRHEALDEVRERIAGFMAMGLVVAIPALAIVSASEFTLVPETEAAEPSTGQALQPPTVNFQAVASRLESVQLTPSEIRTVQAQLKGKGFNPGPIDGIAGKRTLSALNAYRQSIRLSPATVVSRETVADLESH
jgi:putative peptidoglycan binding protein